MQTLAAGITLTPLDVTRYVYLALIFAFTAAVVWQGLKIVGHVIGNGLPSIHLGNALIVLGADAAALSGIRHFTRHYLTHPRSWWESPIAGARDWVDALAMPVAGALLFAAVAVAVALSVIVVVEGVARAFPDAAERVSLRFGVPLHSLNDTESDE